jgi:glycosyltransferase involved in cell wall biosynthesis
VKQDFQFYYLQQKILAIQFLESLLCKTPVIITKNTGLSDYVKKKNIGIICGEKISELSKLFKKINNGFGIKISRKTHKEILNNFDNTKIIKKYFQLFN